MADLQSLSTFDEWKHCITVSCGIPLTEAYVGERLVALRDPDDYGTKKFVEMWGDAHLQRVIGWFEQAEQEFQKS